MKNRLFKLFLLMFPLLFGASIVFAPSHPVTDDDFGGDRGEPGEGSSLNFFNNSSSADFNPGGLDFRRFARSYLYEVVENKLSVGGEAQCLDEVGQKSLVESVVKETSEKISAQNPCSEIQDEIAEMKQFDVCNPSIEMFDGDDFPEDLKEKMKAVFENPSRDAFIPVCKEMAAREQGGEDFGPNMDEMREDIGANWDDMRADCQQRGEGSESGFSGQGQFPGGGQFPQGGFPGQPQPTGTNQPPVSPEFCTQNPTDPRCQTMPRCGDNVCNEVPTTCPGDCPQAPPNPADFCRQNPSAPECQQHAASPLEIAQKNLAGFFPFLQLQITNPGDPSFPGGGGFGGFPGGPNLRQFHRGPDPCGQTRDQFIDAIVGQASEKMSSQRQRMEGRRSAMMDRMCSKAADNFVAMAQRQQARRQSCEKNTGQQVEFMQKALEYCTQQTQPANLHGWAEAAVHQVCTPIALEERLKARLKRIEELEKEIGDKEKELAGRFAKLARIEGDLQKQFNSLNELSLDLSTNSPQVARAVDSLAQDYTTEATETTAINENALNNELNPIEALLFGDTEAQIAAAKQYAELDATIKELEQALQLAKDAGDTQTATSVELQLNNLRNMRDDIRGSTEDAIKHNIGFIGGFFTNPDAVIEQHTQ